MCWPQERPATHAAAGAAARGVLGFGGFFHTLGSGQTRMPPQSDGTRGGGGAVAVCFEGCCGSMCWPRERPATHAAAGAAARGGFWFGGFFCGWIGSRCRSQRLTTGVVRHACRHRVTARGVVGALLPFVLKVVARACVGRRSGQPRMPPQERQHEGLGGLGVFSHAREWSDTHAAAGETARGGFWFGGFFCGWIGSRCRSQRLTTGVVRHACRHRVTARGVVGALLPFVLKVVARACVGRGSGQPRMPPQERQHEGFWGSGDSFTHSPAPLRLPQSP